jgi:hypothetical protein
MTYTRHNISIMVKFPLWIGETPLGSRPLLIQDRRKQMVNYFPLRPISTIRMRRKRWNLPFYVVVLAAPAFDLDVQAPRCKKRPAKNKEKPPSSTLYC